MRAVRLLPTQRDGDLGRGDHVLLALSEEPLAELLLVRLRARGVAMGAGDVDDDELSLITIGSQPDGDNLTTLLGGTFYHEDGNTYSYTPEVDFDIMLYKVSDGQEESGVATVIFWINNIFFYVFGNTLINC